MRPLPSDPVANTLADLRATGGFIFRLAGEVVCAVAAFAILLHIL